MKNIDFFNVQNFSLKPTTPKSINTEKKTSTPKRAQSAEKRSQSAEKKGIESLLEGSRKSHCNTFVGYSRIPHKYDHFHEKTLPNSTVSSFFQNHNHRRSEPAKNLTVLLESLDLSQASFFFTKQQIYQNLFTVSKFSPYKKSRKKRQLK